MFKIRKIMIENNVSIEKLSVYLGKSPNYLSCKLLKRVDFSIDDLNKIKEYFVKKYVISADFDIGEFLQEI